MFIANHQSPEVGDPCDASFHLPSTFVPAQLSSILRRRLLSIALVRTDQFDATPLESLTQRIGIGGFVVDQPLGVFAWPATTTRHRHPFQRGFDQRRFVRGRTGKLNSQRNTLAACHHHPLCTLSAFGLADAGTPFFAGAKPPSAKVSSQSRRPCSSSSPRNVRQMSSQTPCSSQSRSLRQQVLGEGYWAGRSFQRAPDRSTHKIPSKQLRLSLGGRPPDLERLILGNNGLIFFHCSSVSSESCRDMKRTPFHVALNHKCLLGANLCHGRF
jgi:hypothetical protein